MGENRDGGCADFIRVPVANCHVAPGRDSQRVEAAALPIPYLTAWTMLFRKAQLKPGETVLIQAGGSGVSVAAIQIAKLIGATVITTVGERMESEARAASARITSSTIRQGPVSRELKKILAARRKKGRRSRHRSRRAPILSRESMKSLAWGGRLVTCGATSGADVEVDLKVVFFKNLSILGSTMGSKADLLRILELAGTRQDSPGRRFGSSDGRASEGGFPTRESTSFRQSDRQQLKGFRACLYLDIWGWARSSSAPGPVDCLDAGFWWGCCSRT